MHNDNTDPRVKQIEDRVLYTTLEGDQTSSSLLKRISENIDFITNLKVCSALVDNCGVDLEEIYSLLSGFKRLGVITEEELKNFYDNYPLEVTTLHLKMQGLIKGKFSQGGKPKFRVVNNGKEIRIIDDDCDKMKAEDYIYIINQKCQNKSITSIVNDHLTIEAIKDISVRKKIFEKLELEIDKCLYDVDTPCFYKDNDSNQKGIDMVKGMVEIFCNKRFLETERTQEILGYRCKNAKDFFNEVKRVILDSESDAERPMIDRSRNYACQVLGI